MSPLIHGYPDATPLLADAPALRAQAARDGFLFFRGLLPRPEILELRRELLAVVERYGWLDTSAPLMDGIGNLEAIEAIPDADAGFCGVGLSPAAYADVQRLHAFHALAHHPALLAMYQKLFDAEVLPHPRNICRVMLPGSRNVPTPAHQDYIHIQGTPNVWTCWFPVGDCPIELGNLSVAAPSHREGVFPVKPAAGAGGAAIAIDEERFDWYIDNFQAGDVLTFISTTVHKSIPNQFKNRIRLSCDYRYQPVSEPIHESSLSVHCGVTSWEDIYSGWSDTALQYYWKQHELQMAAWSEEIRYKKY